MPETIRFYFVEGASILFHAKVGDAIIAARKACKILGRDITVRRCKIPHDKESIIALANGEFPTEQIVYIAQPDKS